MLIRMLDAATVPSLFLVPCAPMKAPTLSADALEPEEPPLGPDMVVNVVAEEYTTVVVFLARV